MPCNYKDYHPKWKLISWLIRVRRAKGKCEWCGVKNGSYILRDKKGGYRYTCQTDWDMIKGKVYHGGMTFAQSVKWHGFTKVVLTVAHLDHDKTNNRFWNLAALCQRCHLTHDVKQHADNRKYGRDWKKHQLKLPL